MNTNSFTLGIDYGTNSVRALVVHCKDGKEFGSAVFNYPSGNQGVLLDAKDHNLVPQHPGDYMMGLEKSVKGVLASAAKQPGFSADRVIGLGVDTTGSSPIPVDRKIVHLPKIPSGKRTSMPNAGFGKTTPAGRRPLASRNWLQKKSPAIHRQVRQHLLLRMVVEQDLALPQGSAERL